MATREAKSARGDAGPRKKKLHHIEIRPAQNGGHTVEHHYSDHGLGPFGGHEPAVFAFGSAPETVSHLMDHLGVAKDELPKTAARPQSSGEEEAPES